MKRVFIAGAALAISLSLPALEVPDDIREAIEADIVVCNAYEDYIESQQCINDVVEYYSFQWEVRHRHEQAQRQSQQLSDKPESKSAWELTEVVDPLSDKITTTRTLRSTNTHRFRFPFNDDNYLVLQIRQHPRYGNDIIIRLIDGQFSCYTTRCPIVFRIDSGEMITVEGVKPSDGSTRTIFVSNPDRTKLWDRLLNASTILVSTTVHTAGNPVFEFTARH